MCKKIYVFLLFVFLVVCSLSISALAGTLPDTGQTKCYDADGVEIDPCPSPGEPFYGQDANYAPCNPHSYTKLDENGDDLPESATEWVMVRDNVTGLIWEVKTNNDPPDIHDRYNMFNWYTMSTFIAALRSERFGGFYNWRIPTIKELSTLVDISRRLPTININYFPITVPGPYLSSTRCIHVVYDLAWHLHFSGGLVYGDDMTSIGFVRAVRGQLFYNDFIDNGDGTVTDTATGLMWQQATAPGTYTWEEALTYCEGLSLAGYNDWRLPNRNELQTIVSYYTQDPAINTTYFTDTVNLRYWSSTSSGSAGTAWNIDFGEGSVDSRYKSNFYYVRAVRAGQCVSVADLDEDGIPDDGDNSGSPSDNPCTGGNTENCDDNCIDTPNSDQADVDSDGIGDVCDNCPNDPDNDIDDDTICGDVDNCPNDENPDQLDSDTQNGGDVCDICPNDPLDDCDPNGSGGCSIGAGGGTCSSLDGSVTIIVPAGAVDTDTTFSFTDTGSGLELETNRGKVKTAIGINTQPAGVIFNVPVTIILRWDDTDNDGRIDGTNMKENKLYIAKDGVVITSTCDNGSCSCVEQCVACRCDLDANYFEVDVTSFSDYVLVAPLDTDDDGVPNDFDEIKDNCPDVANPNQEDADEDEIGDVCDTCTDKDGDEYGREGLDISGCTNPNVYDCNDLEYSINPGTTKDTTVTYNGDFVVMVDDYSTEPPTGDLNMSAVLVALIDSNSVPIDEWNVRFEVYDTENNLVGSANDLTNLDGNAIATIQDIPVGVYIIVTDFIGDDCYYYSSEDTAALAVCDPTGGFVTGGGWISSPPGAYTGDEEYIEGNANKATFGFVSKYKKGATVPTGETQFVFNDGNLHFHSDTYQWLVIAGAKAQYKGTGTIKDREGEYKFKLTGIDADINDADSFEVDRFRIKIWTEDEFDEETVIYDNSLGDDTDEATTEIGGGSIVIHK